MRAYLPRVYATCLYCTRHLGANAVLETLPIGRRVAFDEHQGRLWVICSRCEKWNLVPFDTRLETIDVCERLFADARLRYSTANIGIARLGEGLELVRIGAPQRPEFAAWRYGDQFGRRRTRYLVRGGALVAAVGAFVVGRHTLLPLLGGGWGLQNVWNVGYNVHMRRRILLRIPMEDGVGGVVTRMQVHKASITRSTATTWNLWLPGYAASRGGFAMGLRAQDMEFTGPRAIEILGNVMPAVNAIGGSRRKVSDAVALMEERSPLDHPAVGRLAEMAPAVRLALEMAAHEDTERTALAGELKLLERRWKEAEEVAGIADSLAVADGVDWEMRR